VRLFWKFLGYVIQRRHVLLTFDFSEYLLLNILFCIHKTQYVACYLLISPAENSVVLYLKAVLCCAGGECEYCNSA
jgi:hypothetical protein